MKPHAKAPTEEQLFEAAEMRAGGFKWETVAGKLHRAVETVRKWPLRYPERWQQAIDRAELRRAMDDDAEMSVVLRILARSSKDDKVRLHAARSINNLRLGLGRLALQARKQSLPNQAIDKPLVLAELLERYSTDELAELARCGAERLARSDGSPEGATPTSAA